MGAATYCSGRKFFFLARKKMEWGRLRYPFIRKKGTAGVNLLTLI